jgi:hypothetical protein
VLVARAHGFVLLSEVAAEELAGLSASLVMKREKGFVDFSAPEVTAVCGAEAEAAVDKVP